MRVFSFIFCALFSCVTWSSSIDELDNNFKKTISTLLSRYETKAIYKHLKPDFKCSGINNDINLLISCYSYLKQTYVTSDIDAYQSYVLQMARYHFRPDEIPEVYKLVDTEYDEVISQLYFNLADIYYQEGLYDLAITYLKKIDNTLDDESVYRALLIYGLIYFEKGDFKKAKYYLGRITQDSIEYKFAKYNLALISMRSRWWSEAENYLKQAIDVIDVKSATAEDSYLLDKIYLTLGYSQVNRKSYRDAKKSFASVSLDGLDSYRALLGLAIAEIGLDNLSKAAPILKHVISKASFTDKVDAMVILPQVYQHANNIESTVKYYKEAIAELEGFENLKSDNVTFDDVNITWQEKELLKRKTLLQSLKILPYINNNEKKTLHVVTKTINEIETDIKTEASKQRKQRIQNYIRQVKYALAVIYDKSVAQNE